MDELVQPSIWSDWIPELIRYWRVNRYSRLGAKLFVSRDLFRGLVGLTNINDSYHGTVFSLIFQKQFYTFYNTYRGNARMDCLKGVSGLEDRFLTEPANEFVEEIEYHAVEERINRMREVSESFLVKSLGGY